MSEMLLGLTHDFTQLMVGKVPTMFTVSKWTKAMTEAYETTVKPKAVAFCAKYDQFLVGDKDRFTSTGVTISVPKCLAATPRGGDFYRDRGSFPTGYSGRGRLVLRPAREPEPLRGFGLRYMPQSVL